VAGNSANSQFGVRLLSGISALQTAVVTAFGLFLVVELFIATPDSMPSAVFLALIVLGFAVALAFITRGLWEGTPAARSASLVWQVLQGAVGLASGEGVFARYHLALLIGVPAVIAIGLILFHRGVREHFER
jgi:hypothetical protein